MNGVSSGPEDVGPGGNYGGIVCAECKKATFVVTIIKNARLVIVLCPTCAEVAAAFKLNPLAAPDDIAQEVESRQDVRDLVENMKLVIAARRSNQEN